MNTWRGSFRGDVLVTSGPGIFEPEKLGRSRTRTEPEPKPFRLSVMVQEFHVVLCFSCRTFQVHQVKKASSRWRCSLCGEKQSLLKEFGRGSSRDCRHHVQKLNSMRGAVMQEEESNAWSLWKQMEANGEDVEEQREKKQSQVESCWSKYLDIKEEVVLEEQEDRPAGAHLHRKRRREESTPEQSDGPKLKKTETCVASKDWTGTSTPSVTGTSVTGTSTPSVTGTSTPSVTGTSTPSVTGTSVTRTSVTGTSTPSVTGTSVTRTSTPSDWDQCDRDQYPQCDWDQCDQDQYPQCDWDHRDQYPHDWDQCGIQSGESLGSFPHLELRGRA
ncbi:MRN complex-interacting protein isoform X1 [Takifugu flavidus]|uniref:MRN complex-interacting protein isoform X1 n=1 Tax=Takifugu flavidus TaxID=433684 RepID=UPI0025442D5C|nr:MRN complex-interacting protein isoform X1 [Takifugu flavidus]